MAKEIDLRTFMRTWALDGSRGRLETTTWRAMGRRRPRSWPRRFSTRASAPSSPASTRAAQSGGAAVADIIAKLKDVDYDQDREEMAQVGRSRPTTTAKSATSGRGHGKVGKDGVITVDEGKS